MALGAAGRWREALDGLLAALSSDREAAQAALLDAFAALGDDDPLVLEYRQEARERAVLRAAIDRRVEPCGSGEIGPGDVAFAHASAVGRSDEAICRR